MAYYKIVTLNQEMEPKAFVLVRFSIEGILDPIETETQ